MPKELTHWWLADRSVSRLPAESPVRHLLEQQRAAWLIGAVLPDTLLHLIYGRHSSIAMRLADRFHDPVAGSSYAPLIAFIQTRSQGPEESFDGSLLPPGPRPLAPALTACLLGVASHMEADIVFHPFVYATAGDDMGRHYRVETDLDLWFLHQGALPPVRRLKSLLLDTAAAEAALEVAAGVFDPDGELSRAVLSDALRLHGLIQSWYGALPWQLTALLLAQLPVAGLRSRHELFYPVRWHQGTAIDWPDNWLDRATGKRREESPDQLAELATARIAGLLAEVDRQGLQAALQKQPGENLLSGLLSLAE